MVFHDLVPALLIALVLTAIFPVGFRGHRGVAAFFLFFILLFLATWAAGIWIAHPGGAGSATGWGTFLVVGVLFALLITAILPAGSPPRRRSVPREQAREHPAFLVTFNLFFWLLVIGLLGLILGRYLFAQP